MSMKRAEAFKELLETRTTILAPGAYDGLSARIIELSGFDVVYATGYGIATSRVGF